MLLAPSRFLDADAVSWAQRCVVNGAAQPSDLSVHCLSEFSKGIRLDSLYDKAISYNCIVPDSLIAAQTPLKVGTGIDPWTNYGGNFTSGNLTINGLVGTGGASNTVLVTGVNASSGLNVDEGTLAMYFYDHAQNNYCEAGAYTSGSSCFQTFASMSVGPGSCFFDSNTESTGRIVGTQLTWQGYYCCSRDSDVIYHIFRANSVTAHASIASGTNNVGARPNGAIGFWGRINTATGVPLGDCSSVRMSFCGLLNGLDTAESLKFYNRIQRMRQQLGGGFR